MRCCLPVVCLVALSCALARPAGAVVVSGRVVGESGAAAANVNIDFIDAAGTSIPLVGDTTDGLGYYAIDVPVGTYDIYYKAPPASGWASRNVRAVTITGTTTRPDVVLPYGFEVSGYVFDRLGLPVADVDLDFDDCVTGETWLTPSDNTDPLGFYAVIVPAGTWTISYDPPVGDPHAGVVVECVTVSGATSRPDVILPDGFVVTARVTDTRLVPVVDANTSWLDAAGAAVHTTDDHTDATGTFAVRVPLGTYDIEVMPPAGSRLIGAIVAGVAVAADRTLPDIVLGDGWLVDGLVVDGAARPLAAIDTDWNLPAGPVATGEDNTDATGRYQVAVPSGTYDIDFDPPAGSRYAAAERLGVVIDADVTLPDMVLDAAWFVTGRVVDAAAVPVFDVDTQAHDAATGTQQRTLRDHSDVAGEYLLALPDGTWDITYWPPPASAYAAAVLRDVVVSGADRRLPDVVLPAGLRLNGRVVDASGAPVALVSVRPRDAATGDPAPVPMTLTDATGRYSATIAAGTYDLSYVPPAPYMTVDVPGVVIASDAPQPDVVVHREVVLTGRVEDRAGLPVADAAVRAVDPATGTPLAPDAVTDPAGAFTLRVRDGGVELRTTPPLASGLVSDARTLTPLADTDVGAVTLLPLLESLVPSSGSTLGGDALTLAGRELVAGMTATLGGMPAALSAITATSATVTTPGHPAGVVDFVATWPDGRSATLRGAFEYLASAQDPVIRLRREGADVLIEWNEAPGTPRTVYGSARPDAFDAGSILASAVTGLSYRHVGEASRPGLLFYSVQ